MAQVQLSRRDAEQADRLPPLCMECGAPATTVVAKKYSTDVAPLPPDPVIGGWFLFPLWLIIALLKLISWSSARTMTVQTPVCAQHTDGWFSGCSFDATSISDDTIVLSGVCEPFAQAWERRQPARERLEAGDWGTAKGESSGPEIKVRCRSCRTLNVESARFCNHCGASL